MNSKEKMEDEKEILLQEIEAFDCFLEFCQETIEFSLENLTRKDSNRIKLFFKELAKMDGNLKPFYESLKPCNLDLKSLKRLMKFVNAVINYKEDKIDRINDNLLSEEHDIFPDLFQKKYEDPEYLKNREIARARRNYICGNYENGFSKER